MICDAHVHAGYFGRKGMEEPYYYSPRKIFGILSRCGVGDFIFSSTNCFCGIRLKDIYREAEEMKRLAGNKAHAFFWVSEDVMHDDPELSTLPDWYEGLKLHGNEYPWTEDPSQLRKILRTAEERKLAVQIHTDKCVNKVSFYLSYCKEFPSVHFDLAHAEPAEDVADACRTCGNVWFDLSFKDSDHYRRLLELGVPETRLMFGSDIPAQKNFFEGVSLTKYLRDQIRIYSSPLILEKNMYNFLRIKE